MFVHAFVVQTKLTLFLPMVNFTNILWTHLHQYSWRQNVSTRKHLAKLLFKKNVRKLLVNWHLEFQRPFVFRSDLSGLDLSGTSISETFTLNQHSQNSVLLKDTLHLKIHQGRINYKKKITKQQQKNNCSAQTQSLNRIF